MAAHHLCYSAQSAKPDTTILDPSRMTLEQSREVLVTSYSISLYQDRGGMGIQELQVRSRWSSDWS